MAKQTILWTVLPNGRVTDGDFAGRYRVSIVVSPRLTPEAASEQTLGAFPDFVDWPETLSGAKLALSIGGGTLPLAPINAGDGGLWKKLFDKNTPVSGFQYKDMSKVNLHSFSVRNVLGFVQHHYGRLAVQATSNHPSLLPWKDAHPDLKGMLTDIGTRTQRFDFGSRSVEMAAPGLSRFFDPDTKNSLDSRLGESVFGPDGLYHMPVAAIDAEDTAAPRTAGEAPRRTLPSDWYNPRPGGPGTPLVGTPDASLMDQFSSAAEYDHYRAMRFYRREPPTDAQLRMRRPAFADIPATPPVPEFDFHRIVASYGDYPELLRALGLVIDCAIEDSGAIEDAINAGAGTGKGVMALALHWSNDHDPASDTTPKTAWQADKALFFARPRGSDIDRGLLRLDHADDRWTVDLKEKKGLYDIYQVDPDGAAHKTVGFTLTAQNLVAKSLSITQPDGEVAYTTGDRQPVAALRSGGLGVSRHGRADQVAADAAAATLKNDAIESGNGHKIVMFAEDLLRGYRVDVAPVPDATAPGKWHTLCAREGDYRLIGGGPLTLPPDEGYVSGPSTTSTASAGADPDDHYLHESLFRWTGWSLCTPRPGLTLRARTVDNTQLQGEEPAEVTDEAENGNGIAVQFKARKGTLPKLRFGQLYRFRARIVDVAGNSLAVDEPALDDLEHASDAVGYWRFEPIDPPAMALRRRLSEGESLERMVVRSNYNAKAADYLSTPDFSAAAALPASQDFEYTADNERHLVPPKSSQQQCELHGMFDPYFTDPAKIKEGYAIAAREAGTLYDKTPDAQIELVTPTSLDQVATTADVPPALPSPENPEGDRLTGGQYIVHREEAVETPYLPDAATAGIALRAAPGHSLPGVNGEMLLGPGCVVRRAPNEELVLLVANKGDWPDAHGFRLILEERKESVTDLPCAETFPDDGRPKWDENARTLTLFVPKGRIVRLLYSSIAHPATIETFGIPHWTKSDAEREFVTGMAVTGCSWMLTPFRHLTLVHATQQPVCRPELIHLTANRQVGAQHADLLCRMVRLHGPSSGKFEIEADWYEWVDDLDKDGPERVHRKGQLGEIQLSENHANEFILSAAVNEQQVDPDRPRARGDRHELGDTRFRLVSYRARATTRFREYLPPSLYDNRDLVTRLGPIAEGTPVTIGADDDPGAPVLDDASGTTDHTIVPASTPPDDPRVLYVVPTFRWQKNDSAEKLNVTRLGNGLRVWLDRPWFSSGDGELLGVVLFGDGARFTDIPAQMQPLVTQWGLDPLWDTGLPKTKTGTADFPARVQSESLRLQERPDGPFVQVVGHRVHWDGDRGLWYCDIELNPGASYMPFVRLALVRYQPHGLPGARVSKVVLSEFAQVLPRRHAVFERKNGKVTVSLSGTVPHNGPMKFPVDSEYQDISIIPGPHESGRNRVELVFQTRDPAVDSDLAWSDTHIIRSAIVGTPDNGGNVFPVPGLNPRNIFAEPAASASGFRTVNLRAGNAVRLASSVDLRNRAALGDLTLRPKFIEPEIWSATGALPDAGGKPARLMLREFERYYTDRTVPERRDGTVRRRRVIEERLVYAAIFDL